MTHNQSLIIFFHETRCAQVAYAGGKGASLARLSQAGFPVPQGFVVSAKTFDEFLHANKLSADIEAILKRVNHDDVNSVDRAAHQIEGLIHDAPMVEELEKEVLRNFEKLKTKFVAVRSSATAEDSKTASWAGELETYLNVTEGKLIESVKKCWSSLYTSRAIFYRFEKKLHTKPVSVAVVVQAMVESEISGVCFTVHPVTNDRNQMVIEACIGLGEALVSGQITPDTYVVHKNDFSILEMSISEQESAIVRGTRGNVNKKLTKSQGGGQKLSVREIQALARLCKWVEQHYHHPQDVEWACVKGKFFILQSRPITTL